jgi:hypothetical protein
MLPAHKSNLKEYLKMAVAAYKTYEVTIPPDNGYSTFPQGVTVRVIPHLKQTEPYAELEQTPAGWCLTTPVLGAEIIVALLERHYHFELKETGTIAK